jgi:hypothetical protein
MSGWRGLVIMKVRLKEARGEEGIGSVGDAGELCEGHGARTRAYDAY